MELCDFCFKLLLASFLLLRSAFGLFVVFEVCLWSIFCI